MSLTRELTIVSTSKDGREIVIQDSTGAYHVTTNPTGYGTPNRATTDTVFLYTTVTRYDNGFVASGHKNPGDLAILTGANYTLTMADMGGVATTPFPDGVLKIATYLMTDVVEATRTSAKVIEGADLSTLLLADSIAVFGEDGIPVFIAIDTSKPNLSTKIYLIKDVCIDGFTEVYPAYSSSEVVLNMAAGESALVTEIGKYADEGGCTDKDLELMLLYREKIAAEIKFSCKNYSAANLLAYSLYTRVKLSCS
jgi:hypothetical protein